MNWMEVGDRTILVTLGSPGGGTETIESDTESMNDVFSFDEGDETDKLGGANLGWDNDSVHDKYPAEVSRKNEELEKRKKV